MTSSTNPSIVSVFTHPLFETFPTRYRRYRKAHKTPGFKTGTDWSVVRPSDGVFFITSTDRQTDGQTDRQTDGRTSVIFLNEIITIFHIVLKIKTKVFLRICSRQRKNALNPLWALQDFLHFF
jgi:hypothetical protein